jgi:PHD/YefM family antitoxin component YafN of YafNO toxin-antitoxin module
MKVITAVDFENRFEEIIDDCVDNQVHYKIQLEGEEAVMLIPICDYSVFQDVYEDWVCQPENEQVEGFDHKPLPVSYLGDAEPETFN